jgi:hypothetical protein
MRTTIALEDELVETAKSFSGIEETSALIKTALTQLVQREAGPTSRCIGWNDAWLGISQSPPAPGGYPEE